MCLQEPKWQKKCRVGWSSVPDLSEGANSAPPDSWSKGRGRENDKEERGRGKGERESIGGLGEIREGKGGDVREREKDGEKREWTGYGRGSLASARTSASICIRLYENAIFHLEMFAAFYFDIFDRIYTIANFSISS